MQNHGIMQNLFLVCATGYGMMLIEKERKYNSGHRTKILMHSNE